MAKVFSFLSLPTTELVIDAVYEGGTKGNAADDVLGKLIPGAGNQGGFRAVGSWDAPRLVILYSCMDDADWPDFITCKRTSATTRGPALTSTTLPAAVISSSSPASPSCTIRLGAWPCPAWRPTLPTTWSQSGAARRESDSRTTVQSSRSSIPAPCPRLDRRRAGGRATPYRRASLAHMTIQGEPTPDHR